MRKVFNFSPGPAMLPEEVLLEVQKEFLDWHGTGMSIMELGHRGSHFQQVADQAETDLRELMNIPKDYHVLFLAGGATTQFAMVPLNLFNNKKTADYVDTGIWSKKALEEAKRYGNVNIPAQVEHVNSLIKIPEQEKWHLDPEAAYVHYTPNETIEGIEFHWVPQTGSVPLVADMTSSILSRPINVEDFGIIYAGAQKNIAPAGMNIVIIHEDLISVPLPSTPTLYSYNLHVEHKSFYNTPPTFCWYFAGLVFAWMKRQGGVKAFAEMNNRKAEKLYAYIDSRNDFYINQIHPDNRSIMNVPFNLSNQELTQTFLDLAAKEGLANLKGHRLGGGIRASLYNAMPEAAVGKLIAFMKEFVRVHG